MTRLICGHCQEQVGTLAWEDGDLVLRSTWRQRRRRAKDVGHPAQGTHVQFRARTGKRVVVGTFEWSCPECGGALDVTAAAATRAIAQRRRHLVVIGPSTDPRTPS